MICLCTDLRSPRTASLSLSLALCAKCVGVALSLSMRRSLSGIYFLLSESACGAEPVARVWTFRQWFNKFCPCHSSNRQPATSNQHPASLTGHRDTTARQRPPTKAAPAMASPRLYSSLPSHAAASSSGALLDAACVCFGATSRSDNVIYAVH